MLAWEGPHVLAGTAMQVGPPCPRKPRQGLEKTSERVFYKYIDNVVGLSCGDHEIGRRALMGGGVFQVRA